MRRINVASLWVRMLLVSWPEAGLVCDFHKLISQTQNVNEQFRDGAKWFHYLNFFFSLAVVFLQSQLEAWSVVTWVFVLTVGFLSFLFFIIITSGSLGNESEIILIGPLAALLSSQLYESAQINYFLSN